jgi:hypothetical protein
MEDMRDEAADLRLQDIELGGSDIWRSVQTRQSILTLALDGSPNTWTRDYQHNRR